MGQLQLGFYFQSNDLLGKHFLFKMKNISRFYLTFPFHDENKNWQNEEPTTESCRDPLIRVVPFFLACRFSLIITSGVQLTDKGTI